MAEFCTFSWWWLIPVAFMALFAMACFFMMHRGGCACMRHEPSMPSTSSVKSGV